MFEKGVATDFDPGLSVVLSSERIILMHPWVFELGFTSVWFELNNASSFSEGLTTISPNFQFRVGQCDSARATKSFGETTAIRLLETGARSE
jgi:hypothetical protein